MSIINAVFEPDVDGTVHLPVPDELRGQRIQISATITAVEAPPEVAECAPPWTDADRQWILDILEQGQSNKKSNGPALLKIMEEAAARGGIQSIPDPIAWQREQRADRPLPGRE